MRFTFKLFEFFHPVGLSKRFAFTLAEVLITLGIIGVVAAITMPSIISNVQKTVLKNQFKSAYSKFSQAIFLAQTKLETPIGCSYWSDQYPCTAKCTSRDPVYNNCISWTCSDDSPLPSNYNGPRGDCAAFEEELFTKTLKVIKFCENNALANGCLTSGYRGTDKIKAEQNPDAEFPPNPNSDFSDNNIKNRYSSWVLADGVVIIKYGNYKSGSFPVYTIDINGHKGPNKWGHDIFTFIIKGDYDGIKRIDPINYAVEKGGKTAAQMIKEH